ncbi:hypothetical protein HQ865_22790 [Mucilaginibacter mali]|uniref:Lipoprotein n=1 Tax=Mucilaginibacter mali TaxID=2740462 RepID=A0A7D4QNH4_9SPHI|nr:hypothetical protein [Mucilaginibacter mali]QKJ32470.1 hypothetical protein HQ865_22790 [Mucilaginibacter mali]
MKRTTQLIALLPAVCLLQACGIVPQTPASSDMTVVFDRTDSIRNCPDAQTLLSPFDLERDRFQGLHIVLTTASDVDVNGRTVIDLKPQNELTSNIVDREKDISRFATQIQQALDSIRREPPCGHSIVYRAVAREANALASSSSTNKYLLVYSDLLEANGEVSFYRAGQLREIRRHPDTVSQLLESGLPLQPLAGMQVFLLYEPRSFADNGAFMPVAAMYRRMLERHGATVHVAAQFSRP